MAWRLYEGDCRLILPTIEGGSVDVILTDPPYNVGTPQRVTDVRSPDKPLVGGDFGVFDEGAVEPAEWMPLALPLLKPGGVLLSFYDSRGMHRLLDAAESSGFETIQDFHWRKTNPTVPMRRVGFSWAVESGYVFRRRGDRHRFNVEAGFSPNYFFYPICAGHERTDHPTQKPEAVMAWLMRHWTFAGQTVLDPFAGSGTTLRCAIDNGCMALGIEQRGDYCEMARERLRQPCLFAAPLADRAAPAPTQPGLFDRAGGQQP